MKVENININDDYIVVYDTDTILEVAKKIAEDGIPDAIVIDKDSHALGALDDYDIISKAVAPEKDLHTLTAADIMYTPPPIYLQTEIDDVHEIMNELEATILPVVDQEKKLLGAITIMDVLEGQAKQNRTIIDKLMGR